MDSSFRAAGFETSRPIRVSTHLRRVVDRGRGAALLPEPDHGDVRDQIDATYGHLVPDSEDYVRGLLDILPAESRGVTHENRRFG